MIPVDWAQGFKRVLLDNPRFMTQGQMMFPILRQTRILGIHLGFNKSQYIVINISIMCIANSKKIETIKSSRKIS